MNDIEEYNQEWYQAIKNVFDSGKIRLDEENQTLLNKLASQIAKSNQQGPQPSNHNNKAKQLAWESLIKESGLILSEADKIFLVVTLSRSLKSPINIDVESKMVVNLLFRDQQNGDWKEVNINNLQSLSNKKKEEFPYIELILQDVSTNELYLQTNVIGSGTRQPINEFNTIPLGKSDLAKLGIKDTRSILEAPQPITLISKETEGDAESVSEHNIIKAGGFYFNRTKTINLGYDADEESGKYKLEQEDTTIKYSQLSEETAFRWVTSPHVEMIFNEGLNTYAYLREQFNPEIVNKFRKEMTQAMLSEQYKIINGGFEENGKVIYLYKDRLTNELMEARKDPATNEYVFIDFISAQRAEYIKANGAIATETKETTKSLLEKLFEKLGISPDPVIKMEKAESEVHKIKMGHR